MIFLPSEIWYEILGNLFLYDLDAFDRTCQSFHSLIKNYFNTLYEERRKEYNLIMETDSGKYFSLISYNDDVQWERTLHGDIFSINKKLLLYNCSLDPAEKDFCPLITTIRCYKGFHYVFFHLRTKQFKINQEFAYRPFFDNIMLLAKESAWNRLAFLISKFASIKLKQSGDSASFRWALPNGSNKVYIPSNVFADMLPSLVIEMRRYYPNIAIKEENNIIKIWLKEDAPVLAIQSSWDILS